MLTEEGFKSLCDEIESLGYDRDTAGHFAALIGDTPITDEHGQIVVMEAGKELAKLKLAFYAP